MKFNILKTFLVITVITLVSCKEEAKNDTTEKAIVNVDQSLNVIVDLVAQKDDNFQIYWTEDGSDNFEADKYVNVDVKGSPESQKIVFKLPEEVLAKQLRFDIGSNKEQKEIKINSLKLKYFDKEFVCQSPDFWKYFGNNTSIAYDKETATAKLITNLPEGFDPIFGGTSNLTKELNNLIK